MMMGASAPIVIEPATRVGDVTSEIKTALFSRIKSPATVPNVAVVPSTMVAGAVVPLVVVPLVVVPVVVVPVVVVEVVVVIVVVVVVAVVVGTVGN